MRLASDAVTYVNVTPGMLFVSKTQPITWLLVSKVLLGTMFNVTWLAIYGERMMLRSELVFPTRKIRDEFTIIDTVQNVARGG